MNQLLRNAIILDTETTSLRRGAGIHELALYEMQSKKLTEYILHPNLVEVTPHTPQDVVNFVSSSKDLHRRIDVSSWQQAIATEVLAQTGIQGNEQAAMEALRWQNPFLYKALQSQVYPHLGGNIEDNTARASRFSRYGISSTLGQQVAVEDLVKSTLPDHLKGKTIWIANAVFESKQIGAQIAAMRTAGQSVDWKNILETYNTASPDPFYVTGLEVNKARVAAQLTGDWRGVFEAYVKHQPAAGQTAVRDIQDVLRSVMSYGRHMQLFKGGSQYFGTGIDVSHKLMALAAGDKDRALFAEAHRAAEDAAIHESYVLEKSVEYASALRAVQENTSTGQLYKQMAEKGQGPLAEISKYFSLLEQSAPELQRANLLKRFGRAFEDLHRTGETHQTIGPGGFYNMTQMSAEGYEVKIPRIDYNTQRFTRMDDLVEHLVQSGEYSDFGIDVRKEAQAFGKAATSLESAALYTDREVNAALGNIDVSKLVPSVSKLRNLQGKSYAAVDAVIESTKKIGTNPRVMLGMMAGIAATGAAWSLVQTEPKDQSSLLGFTYYDWLKAQEGMASQGLAKENRSRNTDFGSPYKGPVVSNEVFADQQMMAEREKWLRSQYGAVHYDPMTGLFGALGAFKIRAGYSFIHNGTRVESGYQGMTGNNLVSLNLNEGWKVSVEDADTITVRRGGVRGALQSFFGLNDGYAFRLAGVDAPEIAHQGRAAQPYAYEAKAALESLMAGGKNTEIIFDPNNLSYGRMMAGLVVDGSNLNYEMVKRGYVGHLPYGKQQDAIVNYASMKRAETQAFGANRGMWSSPWFQAVHTMTEGGQRPTFNTLADVAKVVPNSRYMSLVAISNQAQERGAFAPFAGSAANVGKIMGGADPIGPTVWDQPVSPSELHMTELMADNAMFVKTHGGRTQNKFSRRSGYGRLDQALAVDSMGTTNSVWTRRRYGAFDTYGTSESLRKERLDYMAEKQRAINQSMFVSPIGHYRM